MIKITSQLTGIICSNTHFNTSTPFYVLFLQLCCCYIRQIIGITFLIACYNVNNTYSISSLSVKVGCQFFFSCISDFCLVFLKVQHRFSLKFPYEHIRLFSMCVGKEHRNWPAAA